ncbi:MAG: ribonuclease D [Candidatus Omnitrophica bacterium]|nr:ribonuclease D [Candidatus Omnitrophota bacterium]
MTFVNRPSDLAGVLKVVSRAKSLAIDTEADSLHHYFEKLCLLQVSTPDEDFVIDPLASLDLRELLSAMQDKLLIFQGADFDLKMLRRVMDFQPKEIFDTMIAAQFLGFPNPSLAALVEKYFGIHLPKSNQKADWSRRPLSEAMLAYAQNDTLFLHGLKKNLEKELDAAGRLGWFRENCRAVIRSSRQSKKTDLDREWRIKGIKDLSAREQIFVKELWFWREKEAQRRDRPRFKVLGPEQMIRIAKWINAHPERVLKSCPHVPDSYKDSRLMPLEKTIQNAWDYPPDSVKPVSKATGSRRMSGREQEILQHLKNERRRISGALGIDPSLVASNALLEALIIKKPADLEALKNLHLLASCGGGAAIHESPSSQKRIPAGRRDRDRRRTRDP